MQSRLVYYSRTGTTRLLADAISARLVAEEAEITCARYGPGLFGWLRAVRDSLRGVRPEIAFEVRDENTDCLIIGGPVLAGSLAAPVRSYIAQLNHLPDRIGVFLTSGGPPPHPRAEEELRALLGRAPDAMLWLRAADVREGRHMDEVEDFFRELTHS